MVTRMALEIKIVVDEVEVQELSRIILTGGAMRLILAKYIRRAPRSVQLRFWLAYRALKLVRRLARPLLLHLDKELPDPEEG